MAAPTARYFGYNFNDAKLQYDVAGTLTEVDLLYANTLSINTEEQNIEFEGDGEKRTMYVTTGMTVEITPDAINVAAAGVLFGKTEVTASIPNSGTSLTWFGDSDESAGASAGLRATMSAVKSVGGVESVVTLMLWVPLGTLTLAPIGDVKTAEKLGGQIWRLGAIRTTVDVAGDALPGVPAGGAFYALYEV